MERGKVTSTRGSEGLGRRNRNRNRNRKDLGVVHFRFQVSAGQRHTVEKGNKLRKIKI